MEFSTTINIIANIVIAVFSVLAASIMSLLLKRISTGEQFMKARAKDMETNINKRTDTIEETITGVRHRLHKIEGSQATILAHIEMTNMALASVRNFQLELAEAKTRISVLEANIDSKLAIIERWINGIEAQSSGRPTRVI